MSRIAILAVDFRDNLNVPGCEMESGDLATYLTGKDYDLALDTVLGCVFASRRVVPEGRTVQVRMYPLAVIASMIYAPEPAPQKK